MYSREFIALNVDYAQMAAGKIGAGFIEAVVTLTCIRRTVFRVEFGNGVSSEKLWREFVSKPGNDPVRMISCICRIAFR